MLEDKGTLKVMGNIASLKETMAFDSFQSKPWDKDSSLISRIEFQRVPDWELLDYRSEVTELWDDVRKLVNKYFLEVVGIPLTKEG